MSLLTRKMSLLQKSPPYFAWFEAPKMPLKQDIKQEYILNKSPPLKFSISKSIQK